MRIQLGLAVAMMLSSCGASDPGWSGDTRGDAADAPLADRDGGAADEPEGVAMPSDKLPAWPSAGWARWLPGTSGRTYHVRPDGDDTRDGESFENAWQSVARVNAQRLAPGDRVLLQGGQRYPGGLRLDASDAGNAEAPVTIGSFGEGRATLEAGAGSAIEIANGGGFVIEDLRLMGGWDAETQAGSAQDSAGIHADNALGGGERIGLLLLRRLEIAGFQAAGILLSASPGDQGKNAGFEGVAIADCDVHDNGDVGIASSGPFTSGDGHSHRDFRIQRVRVHHNRGLTAKSEHTGSGIVLADVDGALVERSVAYENGEFNDAAGGGFGIWTWDSNAVVLQYNEAHGNRSRTADGGGFDLDGGVTNSRVQYNYSHDNDGAGFGAFQFPFARPFAGNLIHDNISQNDGVGFLLWDGNGDMEGPRAFHNAVYGEAPTVMTYGPLRGARFANNIFYGVGETLLEIASAEGIEFQGNAYFRNHAPLAIAWDTSSTSPLAFDTLDAFRSATAQETSDQGPTGLEQDPRLVAAGGGPTLGDATRLDTLEAYQLRADSPLIDQGIDLVASTDDASNQDFFGNRRGSSPPDIGAHEQQ
jgi:hypothetical protein